MNKLIKMWNKEFNKGINIFQVFLGVSMILGIIIDSKFLILFSMFNFLFAYFEPTDLRFSIKLGLDEEKTKEMGK